MRPPAAARCSAPRSPSLPMPVITMPERVRRRSARPRSGTAGRPRAGTSSRGGRRRRAATSRSCAAIAMCRSPGAIETLPGRSRSPSAASTHPQRALVVEPLGQDPGEHRGHVLHDRDRHGQGGRQRRDQLGQRRRAAGRHADRDQVHPLVRAGRARDRAGGARAAAAGCVRRCARGPRALRAAARRSAAAARARIVAIEDAASALGGLQHVVGGARARARPA